MNRQLTTQMAMYVFIASQAFSVLLAQSNSQGEATTEIEKWRTRIEDNSDRIRNVQDDILGLRNVFGNETAKLKGVLTDYRQDPTKDKRKGLQVSTIDSLTSVANATGKILDRREETLLGAIEVERKSREKAAKYRADSEQIDKTLPMRQSGLAQTRSENDALKERYLADPNNRDLERKLRDRWRDERRASRDVQHDVRRMQLMAAAAVKLDLAADKMDRLSIGLETTFDSIEDVRIDCVKNADLLAMLIDVEGDVELFTGGAELGELMVEIGQLTDLAGELTVAFEEAMNVFLQPDPSDLPGGANAVPDTEFDRWLNDRTK